MSSTPELPDPRLIEAHDLALAALREITPAPTIGGPAGYTVEDGGVVSLRFETTLPGYPGWFWTVSVAAIGDDEPTVLEVELLPGDGALLAPEWVPWAVRLAEYQAMQAAAAAERAAAGDEGEDAEDEADLEDLDDLDAADFDEDGSPILHAGDVDGVDIDALDAGADDEDDDEDEDLDDSDDEVVVDSDDEDLDEDESGDS